MLKISKIIFIICAVYFFLMGIGLIFLPRYLVNGFSAIDVNPTIFGMLRGAGGSILPYSFLYMIVSMKPTTRSWALYVLFLANVIAVSLDLGSLLLGEYKLVYAVIDIPIEILSIIGISMIWISEGRMKVNL